MNSKECEAQLNSLIEHFNYGSTDINATDIEAIKHLLLENQMQHNEIIKSIKEKDNLIKCLEDKINKLQIQLHEQGDTLNTIDKGIVLGCIGGYQDILERLKNGKYES